MNDTGVEPKEFHPKRSPCSTSEKTMSEELKLKVFTSPNEAQKEAKCEVEEDSTREVSEEEASSNAITSFLADESSASELFAEGKRLFKESKDYERAAELFSRAVEKMMIDLETNDETHPDMADYLLWYGDSLLSNEEQKNDLFSFLKPDSSSASLKNSEALGSKRSAEDQAENDESTQKKAAEDEEEASTENETDEELSFKILELAKIAFKKRLNELKDEEGVDSTSTAFSEQIATSASELAFVHLRLGDIQLMNEQLEGAAADYDTAVQTRVIHGLPEEGTIGAYTALAEARFLNGELGKALENFRFALRSVEKVLSGEYKLPPGNTMKNLEESAEDIRIQVADIEKRLKSEPSSSSSYGNTGERGSQSEAKNLVPVTNSEFDKPELGASVSGAESAVDTPYQPLQVKVAPEDSKPTAEEEYASVEQSKKRRRIDLTNLETS